MPALVPELRRPVRRRQRRRQDVRDDRLAGGLDDRPERRRQGRDQPAVARHLQRRQRRAGRRAGRGLAATCPRWPRCATAFDRRRQTIVRMLQRRSPASICPEPEGAFYAYPSVKGAARQGDPRQAPADLAPSWPTLILEEAEVAVVPGEAFGTPGLPAAVLRARRRGPGRGRHPDRRSCSPRRRTDASADAECGPSRPADALSSSDRRRRSVPRRGRAAGSAWSAAPKKPTCTCTSPGRCGPRRCSSSADQHGVRLPDALPSRRRDPPELRATDERGWFRFQRLYDTARSVRARARPTSAGWCARPPRTTRAEGSGWLEIQVDPTSYAPRLGGLTPALEIVLDAVREAARGHRRRHRGDRRREPDAAPAGRPDPGPAGRAATPAAASSASGCPTTSGAARAADFAPAFAIAGAGRAAVGAARRRARPARSSVRDLPGRPRRRPGRPRRAGGRGPGAAGPAGRRRGRPCEVCPASNVRLGRLRRPADVPLRTLRRRRGAGGARAPTTRCSSAPGWLAQYELARDAPRLRRRGAGRAGPAVGARLARRRTTCGPGCSPASTTGWLRPPA